MSDFGNISLPELPRGFSWEVIEDSLFKIVDNESGSTLYQVQRKVLDACKDPKKTLERAVWRVTGHA